jgi:WD40 repeat protein
MSGAQEKKQEMVPYQKFEGHTGEVRGVACLRGGQMIMTSSYDGSLRVWDVGRGKQIGKDWRDGTTRLRDIDTAKVIAKWMGRTTHIYWNRDSRRVISSRYYDDTAWVCDAETGKTILGPLGLSCAMQAAYSPDGTMIAACGRATGGYDIGRIKIWNANTGKPVANLKEPKGAVTSLAWHEDRKTLISGSHYGKIRIWDTTTWRQITVLTGHTGLVYGFAISPNGRILASVGCGARDKTARLWDLESGQPIGSPIQHTNKVDCLSFSANGKVLATGRCFDNNAYAWDVSAIVRKAGLEQLLSNSHVSLHF